MNIATFIGSDDDMGSAIQEAEKAAQNLLTSLSDAELFSVTAQSFVDRFSGSRGFDDGHTCFHIITITYS